MIRLGKSSEIHRVSRVCRNADVAMAQTQQSVHERTDPVVAEQINSGTELIRIDSCAGEAVTPVIVRARDVGGQRNPVSEIANALRPVRQGKRRVSLRNYGMRRRRVNRALFAPPVFQIQAPGEIWCNPFRTSGCAGFPAEHRRRIPGQT